MAIANEVEPRTRLWTLEEYYRLSELGFFQDQRVELIAGEIIQMPAQKNPHSLGIGLTEDALRAAFGPNSWVRGQMSLDLSPHSVPDPDVAVVAGSKRSYAGKPVPTTALLIVEVSATTLHYDRGRKGSLYASAGIADYWILNVVDNQLEVYRDPAPDSAQPFGYGYTTRLFLEPNDVVSPLAAPNAKITVADLLP
ncbi:MAG TPA: Uma2 family endonuclease [Gemmataceae bacterium]|nr:Uma2 family endonuclease [Gemmataceae bacterium]